MALNIMILIRSDHTYKNILIQNVTKFQVNKQMSCQVDLEMNHHIGQKCVEVFLRIFQYEFEVS